MGRYTTAGNSHGSGHIPSVRLLLDRGAKIEAKNNDGQTALMLAASETEVETVRLLLDRGANARAKDIFGHTALKYSTRDTKKVLLEYMKDPSW
jgi:uncharacterized protein